MPVNAAGKNLGPNDRLQEYLSIVEPFPMEPPSYASTLPWVNKPVYDSMQPYDEPLPAYTPTVYKLGILYRKIEWISPLEMASQRHWKPYIFELNSTQLNLYECPFKPGDENLNKFVTASSFSNANSHSLLHPYHHHHLYLKKLQGSKYPSAVEPGVQYSYNEDNYRSIMTTKTDLKALKYFKSIHALDSTKIIRSYSLQYGRIGLAIDYKKKSHVFRCRFETEQFLVDFTNVEGMIEWFSALNLGIDNSLDLSRREMPNYRTIPRRRRRRLRHSSRSTHNSSAWNFAIGLGRDLEQVHLDPNNGRRGSTVTNGSSSSDFKKKLHTNNPIESLFRRNKSDSKNKDPALNRKSSSGGDGFSGFFKKNKIKSVTNNENSGNGHFQSNNNTHKPILKKTRHEHHNENAIDDFSEDGEDNDNGLEDDERLPVDEDGFEVFFDDDEDEFEIEDSPNPQEDNEYDSSSDDDNNNENDNEIKTNQRKENEITRTQQRTNGPSIPTFMPASSALHIPASIGSKTNDFKLRSYKEYIAKPSPHSINTHTYPAQRKILRDSLRCMPPLIENEKWFNKFVVLDAIKHYKPQSKDQVNRHYQSFEVLTHVSSVGDKYTHKFRRPLQEWIATPSGLLPYINPSAYD